MKCKSYTHFFSKNIGIYAVFNDQNFNNALTNDIVSFEQLGPVLFLNKSSAILVQILEQVGYLLLSVRSTD